MRGMAMVLSCGQKAAVGCAERFL